MDWYRKLSKLFEGMRQAGDILLNGKAGALYENGVTAYGLDISSDVHFGSAENILAVKVDNRTTYLERASNTNYQWNTNDFNPDHGCIDRHVWLHATGKSIRHFRFITDWNSPEWYGHASNFDVAPQHLKGPAEL